MKILGINPDQRGRPDPAHVSLAPPFGGSDSSPVESSSVPAGHGRPTPSPGATPTLGAERLLILVRHSAPEIVPEVPAGQWHLSETGRQRCLSLAERVVPYALTQVVTSREPKAQETGQIVADRLGIPFETAPDLHEHLRPDVGFWGGKEQFQALVIRLFENPDVLVFGTETADQAHQRFARAIAHVLERHPTGNLAVVSHGTVMSLFVARTVGLDPVRFWKRLGLPAFVILSHPGFHLLEVVEHITSQR